jgi:hypothetical protein
MADTTYCYFNDSTNIIIQDEDRITQVNSIGETSLPNHYIHSTKNDESFVYNKYGQKVEVDEFDKLIDLGDQYMLLQNEKRFNILDSTGMVVLEDISAATCLENGYISFLEDNRFGLFNHSDSTYIEARYDRPLKSYSDSLFIFNQDDNLGIINRLDSVLVPGDYEEIQYINDTLTFLKKDFRWNVWDLANSRFIIQGISNYWEMPVDGKEIYKIFKGIGYGIWSPQNGLVLKSTYGEINISVKGDKYVYIAEKWVEEADLVVMLYYNYKGQLIRKEILSTEEYNNLNCGDI